MPDLLYWFFRRSHLYRPVASAQDERMIGEEHSHSVPKHRLASSTQDIDGGLFS